MAAVWMRFGSELRSRWRSWLVLAVLIGIFGGAVVAAAAGARRTDSVVDRYVDKLDPPNVFFVPAFSAPEDVLAELSFPRLLEFDSVAGGERLMLMPVKGDLEVGATDKPLDDWTFPAKLLEGRLPDPRRPEEALVNTLASERYRLQPGDSYTVGFHGAWFSPTGGAQPPGPTVTFRITGIAASLSDFAAIAGPSMTLTPAFVEKYPDIEPFELSILRLREGTASYGEFGREIARITGGRSVFFAESGRWDEARNSFGLQAKAMWVLAALLAALTVLVAGQAIARETFLDSAENGTLGALGLSHGQIVGIALLRSMWIGLIAGALAIVVAAVASPLTPFGTARLADPDPAFSFAAVPMGLGFGAVFLAVIALALYPAFRTAKRGWDPDASTGTMRRPVPLVGVLARIARNPSPAIGARMAFERGRGRTAVPVRTTITATAVCLAALAASLIVGASLDRLSADPSLYGWTWDASVHSSAFRDDPENPADGPVAQAVLRDMQGIAAVTFGPEGGSIHVNGEILVEPFGLPLDATVTPPIMDGRAPSAPDEIAMARQTMRAAGVRLGDTVRIAFQGSPTDAPFRVVGVTVLPLAGEASTLGEGIWLPIDDLENVFGEPIPIDRALVRFERGADVTQLERFIGERFEADVRHAESPGTVLDFGRVSEMPLVLAGIVAFLAAGTLGHGLLTAIRRRRRDLSILKSLGFDRRQIRTAVGWQATATALVTLVIGLSLGIVAGRLIWTALANNTGFVAEPVVEISVLGIAVAAALIGVNLIAILPGRAAARTQPAVVLRTE